MLAPLSGIKVVELSNWLAAPGAAALMRDMGADVIKIEPPGGDAFRHFDISSLGYDFDFDINYAFEADNRGKRSVTVSLDRPGGPELVKRLCDDADVFITNLIQPRRERYGLGADALRERIPRLIYVSLSGYGTRGPDAARPGFDYAAFWARSGIMGALGEPSAPPPLCRGGQGDHTTSLNLLAATLAALRLRDASGQGQTVEVTLQGTGMWTIGTDLSAALIARRQPARHDFAQPSNPIWNSYETRDGRWILLVMPQPDPYWPRFCESIGESAWARDARYDSVQKRRDQSALLTRTIADRVLGQDLDYWRARLDEFGIIWAPVASIPEVVADPQPREMGAIGHIDHPTAGRFETLNTPFTIEGADIAIRGPAPQPGEHTYEVLAELGVGDDELARLAADGVLG